MDSRRFLASTGKGELWLFKVEGNQLVGMKKWDKSEMLCDADSFSGFDSLDGLVALATTNGQVLCFPYTDTSDSPSSMINPDGKRSESLLLCYFVLAYVRNRKIET